MTNAQKTKTKFEVGDWVRIGEWGVRSHQAALVVETGRKAKYNASYDLRIRFQDGAEISVCEDEISPYVPEIGEWFEAFHTGQWWVRPRQRTEPPAEEKTKYPFGIYRDGPDWGGWYTHDYRYLKFRPAKAPEMEKKPEEKKEEAPVYVDGPPLQWKYYPYTASGAALVTAEDKLLYLAEAVVCAEFARVGDKEPFSAVIEVNKPWCHVAVQDVDGVIDGIGASLCSLDDLLDWEPAVGIVHAARRAAINSIEKEKK